MKKKIAIAIFLLILVIMIVLEMNWFGRKPFENLSTSEVVSAEIFIIPPDSTIKLIDSEDINELVDILNELVIYREDESGREYSGQLVQVTVTLKNGKTFDVGAYNPFLFVNKKCYRTKYEPCERLNAFGNRILNQQ